MPLLLIDLVLTRLREQWLGHDVTWNARTSSTCSGEPTVWDVYIDHTWVCEVWSNSVRLWVAKSLDAIPQEYKYSAADPKFFIQVCEAVATIMDRHIRLARESIDRGLYFKL